jgi:DNA-binding NarL/FixJ family response regulator
LNTNRVILIVAPPGDLQIGLQALLTTHLDVDVLVTGVGSSALNVIEKHNPSIVVLDIDLLSDAVSMIITYVKYNCPETACVVMVNDDQARSPLKDQGADFVLLKGFPALKLVTLIEDLLSQTKKLERK